MEARYEITHMPFGRYAGKAISTLPKPYLTWCIETFSKKGDASKADLVAAFRRELRIREENKFRYD